MFRLWGRCRMLSLSDVLGSHISQLSHGRVYSTTPLSSVTESAGPTHDESDLDSLIRVLSPAGSAMFSENMHFSPVVFPDPVLDWGRMRRSLSARNRIPTMKLEHLEKMAQEMNRINQEIASMEQSRKSVKIHFPSEDNNEELREEARLLRSRQRELKTSLHELSFRFQKQTLSFPNYVHEAYLVGRAFPACVCVLGLAGTFLTDQLAALEQTLLARTHLDWLTTWSSTCRVYPLALSDFARGPAVEGASWPTVDRVS
ncbi:hypothetical protein FGIG_08979 [Fasciola gigantica]|uniref:Uncharacterized protein n=1 Tax=Fasciola gigantica TaxID=46835 RepID=A0A504XTI8_FASGI|nr:hypothetical protein FGIG_08979 [Fasciola gigantica]